MSATMDRRTLLKLLGGSVVSVGVFGCRVGERPEEALARLLGLEGEQVAWLTDLTPEEQAELVEQLTGPEDEPVTERGLDLAAKILGRRSRLFAFVSYPGVADARSVCDGLVRE